MASPFSKLSASDVDENGQNYVRMGIGLSNQKKVVRKGYMSSSISGSSKGIAQRKTILSARNEKSESVNNETQMQTGTGLDPNSCNGANSRQSGSVSCEDSALNKSKDSSVNDGLSTDQYDPLTNYLSPRPKFLRYRPNRSREIFLRQQNEVGEEIYGATALSDEQQVLFSSDSSSEEISDNEQEEEEEKEEDREESEESDEKFEEVEEDKGWTLKGVLKFLVLLMATILYAAYLFSMNTKSMSSHDFESNEVLSNISYSLQNFRNEAEFAKKLQRERDFFDRTDERRKGLREEDLKMINDEPEINCLNEENFFQEEEVYGELTNRLVEVAELKDGEREVGGFEKGEDGEGLDLVEGEELEFEESSERKRFENVIETQTNVVQTSLSEVSTNSEIAANKELVKSKTDGPEKMTGSDSNILNFIQIISESLKTQSFFQIPASFLGFLFMLIVSVVCYQLKKKKNRVDKQQYLRVETLEATNENTSKKGVSLPMKASSESVMVQEHDSILSQEVRPLASIWSMEEKDISDKRYYNSRAPTVELLGEFVVGGEPANTLKNRMIESKDSNNLVPIEERSAYSRPALSELSNAPPHGSFTAEKIVKKEVGGDGGLKVISTPVRRSSRIKNRAAMSP